jgi:hypothetical protein
MKMRLAVACAIILAIGKPASAHRLDEYLQATTISIEKAHVQVQMRLTPGIAVYSKVLTTMDTNGDGVISEAEQRTYAERVLRDLSLTLDGERLQLRLVSWKFAKTEEMKAGLGDIQLAFDADVSPSNRNRRLIFENHHQSRIAAYLVNCLVPRDPDIQVTSQHRNYQQSRYELDYAQAGVRSNTLSSVSGSGAPGWLGAVALLLFAPLAWLWRRARVVNGVSIGKTVSPGGRGV